MNGNINILTYTINKELEEIKRLVEDFKIKQKIDNIKINLIELEKSMRAKENYYRIFIREKKDESNN